MPSAQYPEAPPFPWLVTMQATWMGVPDTPDAGAATLTGARSGTLEMFRLAVELPTAPKALLTITEYSPAKLASTLLKVRDELVALASRLV